MKLTNLFALSLLLIVGLVFSVYAGKSDCTNLDGDGAKPITEVSSEDVAVQNDYDMVIEEDDRDGVVYLALVVHSLCIYYIFTFMFHYLYRRPLAFSEFFFYFIS